ncbi:MAG: hypothetical protein K9L28_08885 [Synergistales bacterium]|nr:hypothetical protein [Synergistales bacterium]
MENEQSGDWHVDLLSYMLGVRREEVDSLVQQYLDSGGHKDPASMFGFLSAHGRNYAVLWAVFPYNDQISLLMSGVVGPDREIIWWGVAPVPFGGGSGVLTGWNRALELTAGHSGGALERISESEWWAAEQVARHCGEVWPGLIEELQSRLESAYLEEGQGWEKQSFFESPVTTREASPVVEKRFRDATGTSLRLAALRLTMVSLPDLRDLGLAIDSLQNALDVYVESTITAYPTGTAAEEAANEQTAPESMILPDSGVRFLDPVIDPVEGIALSALEPGDGIMLERREGDPLVGQIYMVRILRNGHYELHGKLRGEGGFFRCISPGDIRVKRAAPETLERPVGAGIAWAFVAGAVVLFIAAIVLVLS